MRGGGGGPLSLRLDREPHDGICNLFYVILQIDCGNMKDDNAVFSQPCIAAFVALWAIAELMTRAIDLDGQFCLCAIEVQHVWPDWMLSAKDRLPWRALAQSGPQPRLWRRESSAKVASLRDTCTRHSHAIVCSTPPPPRFARSPSPASRGRIARPACLPRPTGMPGESV